MPEEIQVIVNYESIIKSLGEEIQDVWYGLKTLEGDSFKDIVDAISNIKSIEISDEQSFVRKREERKTLQSTLYIVVKFGAGGINYGSSVVPVTLLCVGTANKVKPAQYLLGVFSSQWTTKNLSQGLESEIKNALQVWNTPEVITNFNEIDSDFKNLFRLSGNIVVGPSAVRMGTMTYWYGDGDDDCETVNIMSFQDGYRASLDSQPFGNTHSFVKSEQNFSTYTFSISTYLLNNHLSADMLAIRGFRNRNGGLISSKMSPNDPRKVKLDFENGFTNVPKYDNSDPPVLDGMLDNDDPLKGDYFFSYFKIVDSQIGQEIAGIPTLTITFTR